MKGTSPELRSVVVTVTSQLLCKTELREEVLQALRGRDPAGVTQPASRTAESVTAESVELLKGEGMHILNCSKLLRQPRSTVLTQGSFPGGCVRHPKYIQEL